MEVMESFDIYIDGACRNNGSQNNIGAYSFFMRHGEHTKQDVVVEYNTTNNRMELMSAIHALQSLNSNAKRFNINVYSDSQYVVNGVNIWSHDWIKKNFRGVKNSDLWSRLISLVKELPNIKFIWVKGHSDNTYNVFVDNLCNSAMDKQKNS